MTKNIPILVHKRKYITYFLTVCPKKSLEFFLTNHVRLTDECRVLAIRRFVDNRTPKQLALEFCVSSWWIGEKLKRIEESLIPQLEVFFLNSIAKFNDDSD